MFCPILEKLTYAMDQGLLHAEEEGKFTEVAAVFVSHCVEFIKKHRHFIASDPDYAIQLENILKWVFFPKTFLHCRQYTLDFVLFLEAVYVTGSSFTIEMIEP